MLNDLLKDYQIILASNSPRRKLLIKDMGLNFEVVGRKVKEVFPPNYNPEQVALHLARLKADAFTSEELKPNKILITADTVVAIDDKILGKPISKANAIETLQRLSGRSHEVITGICLRSSNKMLSFASTTKVYFKELTIGEIEYYISTYFPFDKAGAYGIQEWIGHVAIERIEGSYFNVMGLPTHALYEELSNFLKNT